MATFTITSTVNIDSLIGRTGGDTYNINGGALTIDEDARYGLNANTSAIYGAITPSATLGGSVFVDGRSIWLIPYTGGSGNVPAYNTTISKGSATGLLIGVYSALNVAPTTPGSAMPANGYIKLKQWNGTLYGTGALTGITATAASGETVGWIEPSAQEGTLCLLSTLNQTANGGYFSRGDWYTVGTTSGSRASTYQIPTNGVDVYHGGVLVDKAAATNITNMSWSSGTMTVTSTAHGLTTGDRVIIDDVTPRAFRTVDSVSITVVDANTFTYPLASNPGTYTSGGTVAAVEWYAITNTVNTKIDTDAYRGKVAWLEQSTGLLRFGNDGTTSTGGYLPASGLIIRLPNIMTSCATSGARTVNSLNSSVSSRWRWYNGALGISKSTHLSGSWSPSVFQTGKQVIMADSCHHGQISIASQLDECSLTNVCVGGNGTTTATSALSLGTLFNSSTYTDCVINGNDIGSTHQALSMGSVYNATFTRCRIYQTGDKSAAVYNINLNICKNILFTKCDFGGGVTSSQASFITISNINMWSVSYGRTTINNPVSSFSLTNLSTNWNIDTINFPTPAGSNVQRTAFIAASGSSDNGILRNIGTRSSPIDMRLSGYQDNKSWTRVTTTATVTETGHPYAVGDQIVVYYTSSLGAINLTVKTITAVTANTFDFTCLNAGAASGTISYYGGGTSAAITLTGPVSNWKVQNFHLLGTYAVPTTGAVSNFGVTLQDITFDPRGYNLLPNWLINNGVVNSIYLNDYPLQSSVAVSGVQGMHFMDAFQREPSIPGQSSAVTGVSWTRSTTTITVTSPNHGLTGAFQRIWVENSSSTAAVANGWGASGVTVFVIDANTFTFTGLNAGSASGTLDYKLFGDSIFQVKMSEASSSTANQAQITVNGGAAGFTGASNLVLPAVGDQATWETPSYITSFTNFGLTPAIPYGNGITTLATSQRFDLEYALDRGSGFGSWRNAAYYRTYSSGGTSGTNTITLTAIGNVAVNDYIMGEGIPSGTKVVSIASDTITLNNNLNANASGVYTFWYMPNESAFPSTGVKLKVRATTNATNTASFWQIDLPMLSNSTTRGYLYSQLDEYTLTLTGLQTGSDISIRTAGVKGTAIVNVDANAGTTYDYTYYYAAGTYIDIDVYKAGYKVAEVTNYLLTAEDVSYPVSQILDLEYA